jgi:hypothetical protein
MIFFNLSKKLQYFNTKFKKIEVFLILHIRIEYLNGGTLKVHKIDQDFGRFENYFNLEIEKMHTLN